MAIRQHLTTLKYAIWLGWEVESNWTHPILYILYSLAKPIAAALILVFMYLVIMTDVSSDPVFFSYMYIGNAFYLFIAEVLFGVTWVLHEDREHFQTLKQIYMAPISFYLYIVGRAVSKALITASAVVVVLLFGVVFLQVPIDPMAIDYPLLLCALGVGMLSIVTLGVALAGMTMLTAKHGAGINEGIAGIFYFFCGVIFPITILPQWGQGIALAIPFTYWLEAIRRSLVPGIGIEQVSGLSTFTGGEMLALLLVSVLLFLVISVAIFKYADYRARKMGKLDMITTY